MVLGQQLERILKERRISLSHLARETKVPKATLHGWTTGQRSIDPIQVKKVAHSLGVSIHHLLFGESDPLERAQGNTAMQTNIPVEASNSLIKDSPFEYPNALASIVVPTPQNQASATNELLNSALTNVQLQEIFSGDLRVTIHRITPLPPHTSPAGTPPTNPTSAQHTNQNGD